MRDESQLEDMRAAIRGDFDRLAERRGGQELMNVRTEVEHVVPELPEAEREAAAEEAPRPPWLARLLGR